jgi:cytochrome c2
MPSFEWNKILASILTALIVAMVSGILAEQLYQPEKPAQPVFQIAGTPSASPQPAAPSAPKPIAPLLAKASAAKGKSLTTACAVCHSFNKGGPNKIGPNLYGIVGATIAEDRGGFDFSSALAKHKGTWTPDLLNAWLENPQKFAAGTKMTFAGIPSEKERADVIAYLQSLGGKPRAAAAPKPATASAAPKAAAPAPAKKSAAGFAALLAKADPKKGRSLATVCSACHSFNKGGPNKIGPNLYGVVGAEIAEDRNGFEFSSALEKHKGAWTPDLLNEWLEDPQKFAPGTKMTFAGVKKADERADIVAYLQSLGGKPTPKAAAPAPAKKAATGVAALLAKADPKKGRSLATVCSACHSFNKGGANKFGPNLFGVVGTEIAEDRNGFRFSPALKKHKGAWTPELLSEWLEDPAKFAPGTTMAFAGVKKDEERADIIAYLQSLK